uniref:Putative secreted protein n=1 Tax=Rhipicephalus microplus TaxID=6941 RepID=A0A6G5A3U4_RHIMP
MKCTCCYLVLWSVIVTCVGLLLDEGHSWHNFSRERHYLIPQPPDEYPPLKEEDRVGLLLDEGHSWHNSSRERHYLMAPPPDEYPSLKEKTLMSALKNTSNQEGRNDISLRPQ